MDIEKQLGLDYLGYGRRRGDISSQQRGPAGASESILGNQDPVAEAAIAYGRGLMEDVNSVAPRPAHLHELVERRQIPINVALQLVDYFERENLIEVIKRDLKGDHELRLTPRGRDLIR